MNELVFRGENGTPMTTSLLVAEVFGKAHRGVLRDIDNLDCSEDFQMHNFVQMFKIRELPNGGQAQDRYYNITRDGFTFLAMGYTGKKAAEFKEKYIAAFNAMEQQLKQGTLITEQFMQTQMQMMNQMMQLCNTMMQYMGGVVSPQSQPVVQSQPQQSSVINPEEEPTIDDFYPWEGVVNGYARLRRLYPNHVTVIQAAEQLRSHGIGIRQKTLYRFLREEGYISGEDRTYHRPSLVCVEKGWMVCTQSGRMDGYPKRRYHTPHLSPEFVEMLKVRLTEYIQRQLEFGKEVQS
jgi:Rha family phage regulatory protein